MHCYKKVIHVKFGDDDSPFFIPHMFEILQRKVVLSYFEFDTKTIELIINNLEPKF